jgi:chromosome segregation ATPase
MAYITRNANIVLLFLILISAGALVAATVFFQENFDRLNRAYQTKLTQLNEVTKDLDEKQSALETIKSELTLKAAREEEFTQQYTTVREEKTTLEGEKKQLTAQKESLTRELEDTESELSSTRNSLEAVKGENERLKVDLADATADVAALKDDKDELEDAIDAKNAKISCLQSKPDAEESTC